MITSNLNKFATHPLQAFEWGEFRKKTGVKVIRADNFQLTIHPVPKTKWTIGYLPKGLMPDKKLIEELKKIGRKEKCIFIQLEPNIEKGQGIQKKIKQLKLLPSAHPLFTPFTFQLNLTENEEDLLKNMHSKTRYNIKVAQKHGVEIIEDNSDAAFNRYLRLTNETTKRQKFYAHTEKYHKLMWETLRNKKETEGLSAHLFLARYKREVLAAWILFVFKDTLYYPYGASSTKNREAMASTLMMWEVIKFGKKMELKNFDMWGSLGPNPNPKDPWYGFHRFKQGYGARLVEFIGSYDLVINPILYKLYVVLDKLRWAYLKLKRL
jgi:lipid II:glycine glycyltransferase (peptidoglycan interpeptide bridge formation enzyme)